MKTVSCATCGALLHPEFAIANNKGYFCDEECSTLYTQPIPIFDGWDEGSPLHGADVISRQHNNLFLNWEKAARKEM